MKSGGATLQGLLGKYQTKMNKETLGKIEAALLLPLIFAYYAFLPKCILKLIVSDILVSEIKKVSFWSFAYNFAIHEDFRSTVYIRLGWRRIFVSWIKPGAKCFYNLTKYYGDSLFIQHGFSTVIYAKSIGHHFFVNQQVTIGFGDDGNPTIGNHVSVRAGAKIIGNVTIGDDVVIGANAVVVKDVPSHSVVVGVPGRIVKTRNSMSEDWKRVDVKL